MGPARRHPGRHRPRLGSFPYPDSRSGLSQINRRLTRPRFNRGMTEMMLFLALLVAVGGLALDAFKPLTQAEAERDDESHTPRGWY